MSLLLRVPLFTLLCGVMLAQSTAQAPPNPCTAAQQKQLDFWLGEWNATWPGQSGGPAGHGTNSITRVLDGCVVQESFVGEGTPALHGTSLSIFDLNAGKWKQTWVDNQGSYLDFTGEFKDGQMVLQREATGPHGAKFLQRMVWKNIAAKDFDWSWEASHDDGKTWQVQWAIHYKRKA